MLVFRVLFSWCPPSLWLLHCFCLLFHRVSEPWGEGFDEGISFSAECPKVSHSLHIVRLWVWASLPPAAGGSYPDAGWARHWSVSMTGHRCFIKSHFITALFGFDVVFFCVFVRILVFDFIYCIYYVYGFDGHKLRNSLLLFICLQV